MQLKLASLANSRSRGLEVYREQVDAPIDFL